jgi:hypothetical protein
MHHNLDDDDFNPDDMSELEGIFTNMIADNETGFVMEFIISRLAAKELVNEWIKACYGDAKSLNISLHEYAKIITEIERALIDED